MEGLLGRDAVMVASAVPRAQDPVAMARAMRDAVQAGRLARRSRAHTQWYPRHGVESRGGARAL